MEKKEQLSLNIEKNTATQFKAQARKWRTNHSQSLQLMLDFFTKHGIPPNEDLRPNIKSLESELTKQLGTNRAILLKIEQKQTRPTHAILQNLLQHQSPKRKILVEKKLLQPTESSTHQKPHNPTKSQMDYQTFKMLKRLFKKTHVIKDRANEVRLSITLTPIQFAPRENKS